MLIIFFGNFTQSCGVNKIKENIAKILKESLTPGIKNWRGINGQKWEFLKIFPEIAQ